MSDLYRRIQYWLHRHAGRPFPSPPGTRRIVDRKGRMYYLVEYVYEGGAAYTLRVDPPRKHERGRTGYMNLHLNEVGVLQIADLYLHASVRARGLGTQLLAVARRYAKVHDVEQIIGFVTRSDVEETPYLLDWYARQGFEVTHRSTATRWAADIVYHIRPCAPGHDCLDSAGSCIDDSGCDWVY